MRRFLLARTEDVSGCSGTGHVAEGVEFHDGTVAMRWRVEPSSTALYASIVDVVSIHGHEGRTTVQWLDLPPDLLPVSPHPAGVSQFAQASPYTGWPFSSPEDTVKKSLLPLLTAALTLGTASAQQTDVLGKWADKHLPQLIDNTKNLLQPPFTMAELERLAMHAVVAAQELKGVFAGKERAKIAQTVLSWAVQEVCPDSLEAWVVPLVEGDGVAALIESAFLKLFPEKAPGAAPVVDAPDVAAGGIQ